MLLRDTLAFYTSLHLTSLYMNLSDLYIKSDAKRFSVALYVKKNNKKKSRPDYNQSIFKI